MFDITSSKLLILAVVALIVVGPKDLPILLRTVGKYLGVIRRQAAEFRHQFDEAMRESELDQLKKEFEAAAREVHSTVESGARSIEKQVDAAASVKPESIKFGTGMTPATPLPEPSSEIAPSEVAEAKPAEEPQPAPDASLSEREPGRGAA